MTETDRERWNRRYAERYAERVYDFMPSRWLPEIEGQLKPPYAGSRALDLACGPGRNAVWLAERGWSVDAWDLSDVALSVLVCEREERAAHGFPLPIHVREIDLDDAEIPSATYDLVLNMLFLDRRLWPPLAAALRPGGLLVFRRPWISHGRRPEPAPAHVLQPGSWRAAFSARAGKPPTYDEDGSRGTVRLFARRPDATRTAAQRSNEKEARRSGPPEHPSPRLRCLVMTTGVLLSRTRHGGPLRSTWVASTATADVQATHLSDDLGVPHQRLALRATLTSPTAIHEAIADGCRAETDDVGANSKLHLPLSKSQSSSRESSLHTLLFCFF
jgi:SAM-dependent methyltransferase